MLKGFLRSNPVPLCYLAGLTAVSVVFEYLLSPGDQDMFDAWASTNLANLPHRPVSTMVVSGLIAESGLLPWLVLTGSGLFLLVRRFGNLRTLAIVGSGHVVGTLVSEGVVLLRIHRGALPAAERDISDVGPSYIAAAALVAAVLYAPRAWQRALAAGGWLVAAGTWFDGIGHLDVAPVGHVVAMLTSAAVGGWFALRAPAAAVEPRPADDREPVTANSG